jgi:hypothetical protein
LQAVVAGVDEPGGHSRLPSNAIQASGFLSSLPDGAAGLSPEAQQVEGKPAAVLEGEEDKRLFTNQAETHVVMQDEFPQVVTRTELSPQPTQGAAGLSEADRLDQEGTARLRDLTERGHAIVEEAIEKARESPAGLLGEECPDGVEVDRRIFGEGGGQQPTGSRWRRASKFPRQVRMMILAGC